MPNTFPHTITDNQSRPLVIGTLIGVPNAAGGSAGASVTAAVTFVDQYNSGTLPPVYTAFIQPSQNCFATISGRISSGFNVVLTPVNSSTTLAAGAFDVTVVSI